MATSADTHTNIYNYVEVIPWLASGPKRSPKKILEVAEWRFYRTDGILLPILLVHAIIPNKG